MIKQIIFVVFIIYITTNNAYAYLDPGTGGIILQAILAILATILVFFRETINKLKIAYYKLKSYLKKK